MMPDFSLAGIIKFIECLGESRVKKKLFSKGSHDLAIIAEDEAGNRETSEPIVITV